MQRNASALQAPTWVRLPVGNEVRCWRPGVAVTRGAPGLVLEASRVSQCKLPVTWRWDKRKNHAFNFQCRCYACSARSAEKNLL